MGNKAKVKVSGGKKAKKKWTPPRITAHIKVTSDGKPRKQTRN